MVPGVVGSSPILHPKDLYSNNSSIILWRLKLTRRSCMNLKTVKSVQKKSSEELQNYLHFKKRSFSVPAKKGKGSFNRKTKHKNRFEIS